MTHIFLSHPNVLQYAMRRSHIGRIPWIATIDDVITSSTAMTPGDKVILLASVVRDTITVTYNCKPTCRLPHYEIVNGQLGVD